MFGLPRESMLLFWCAVLRICHCHPYKCILWDVQSLIIRYFSDTHRSYFTFPLPRRGQSTGSAIWQLPLSKWGVMPNETNNRLLSDQVVFSMTDLCKMSSPCSYSGKLKLKIGNLFHCSQLWTSELDFSILAACVHLYPRGAWFI